MTKKEQILKAVIELAVTEGRLDEVSRGKLYSTNATYSNNRKRILEDKCDKLRDIINGKESTQEIKLTLLVPESLRKNINVQEDIIQYLKREHLEFS